MANPLLAVVAVLPLLEGIIVPLRIPAPAAVLDHTGIAVVGEPASLFDQRLGVVVIRSAHEDSGKRAVGLGEIDVGGEVDAVTHGYFYIKAHLHRVVGWHCWLLIHVLVASLPPTDYPPSRRLNRG